MTITYSTFTDWIKQQSPDKPIDMRQSTNIPGNCGCVMVQFAQANNIQCDSCGFVSFGGPEGTEVILDINGTKLVHRAYDQKVTNYAQLQALILHSTPLPQAAEFQQTL